jgi:hypothetical protein
VGFGAEVLRSDARVRIDDGPASLSFTPVAASAGAGLVFYPGCPVPAESYAPLARWIAERGHPVHVMRLPLRCAPTNGYLLRVLAGDPADHEGGPQPAVGDWRPLPRRRHCVPAFATDYPHELQSLILIGTTHPRDTDLSKLDRPVTKIFGTLDGVAKRSQDPRETHSCYPPRPPGCGWKAAITSSSAGTASSSATIGPPSHGPRNRRRHWKPSAEHWNPGDRDRLLTRRSRCQFPIANAQLPKELVGIRRTYAVLAVASFGARCARGGYDES